jgi:hypothetical protein
VSRRISTPCRARSLPDAVHAVEPGSMTNEYVRPGSSPRNRST